MNRCELGKYFNRSRGWISKDRAEMIIEKYNELSIKTVNQELDYQDNLARLFVDCVLAKEFKTREVVDFMWGEYAHSANLAMFSNKMISKLNDSIPNFLDKRTLAKLELFQDFLIHKQNKIEKYKVEGR